jgi:membrane protease YdiL (CAAX protease family)
VSGRLLAWLGLVTAMIAVAYGARAAGGDPPDDLLFRYDIFVGGTIQYALILGIVLAITWGRFDLLALRRPSSLRRAFGYAALALIVTFVVGGIVEGAGGDPGGEQGLLPKEFDSSRAVPFALNCVTIALVAPAIEELTFRGLGYSLLARYGRLLAIVAVGLAFGLVHGLFLALPILAAFGAGLALLRERTDSVYPPFVAHALFNALSLTLAVTT